MIYALLFSVPEAAARAIAIERVAGVAELSGVTDCRLEFSCTDGHCRICCSTEMAYWLLAAFREGLNRVNTAAQVVLDCRIAAAVVIDALEACGAE